MTFAVAAFAAETGPALGAPDFRPTPEHAFGFRGDGSGRFPSAPPPTEWSLIKNVRWSAVVGRSFSSPIVTDKFVYLTSEPNLLFCLNRADGKVAWKLEVTPALLSDEKSRAAAAEYKAKESGMTAATPLLDGETLYSVYANGIILAVDLNGKPKWTAYIDAEQTTAYGRSASPIIYTGKLIVHMTNLYAFDPATGKQVWVNNEAKTTYGSPGGTKIAGTELIVTSGGDIVRAGDGKGLNSGLGPSFHTTPGIQDGIIYFGDHEITAIKLNDKFKEEEQWNGDVTGDVFGSPLLHDGLLYTVSALGELCAFDLKGKGSAKPVIEGRMLFGDPTGSPVAYASLTLGGKHLFINSLRGETVVLEATREAKEVGRNSLKEGSGASPVFFGKDLFLRDGDKLYCIGE